MTKISQLSLLIMLIIVNLCSCKKGDEDPWLSLQSRNERIEGNWTMKFVEIEQMTQENTDIEFNNVDCNVDDLDLHVLLETIHRFKSENDSLLQVEVVINNDGDGLASSFNVTYSLSLDIEKGGDYSCRAVYSYFDNATETQIEGSYDNNDGSWFWIDGNKNKSAIQLNDFPIMESSLSGFSIAGEDKTFEILRLSKDELKLTEDISSNEDESYVTAPYSAYGVSDTTNNCIQTTHFNKDFNFSERLNFKQ